MEEEVKQDTSETETQEKRNTEECEETAEASAENTETPEDGETSEEKDKKGFFSGRKKEKKEDAVKAQINELQDKVMRQMAEFENFRKRSEKEKSAMFETGAKSVIEKILPVVDNFERGLAQAPEDDPFAEGMQKIYKQFTTTMEGMGVEPIEAVGKEFNPDFHNAVMHVEDEELGENVVAEEFQKGYMYRDSVVRHSMVKVAN